MRAAELRSVTQEFKNYQIAATLFQDEYQALPGDIDNAEAYWGEAHATPATCSTTSSTGTETCDGDDNGSITYWTGSVEYFRFWQHLSNAGLIEGHYTGVVDATNTFAPSVNIPHSKLGNTVGWNVYTDINNHSGHANFFDTTTPPGHRLSIFSREGTNSRGAFSPKEAWNIDSKMDDGHPSTGKVLAPWSDNFSAAGTPCSEAADSTETEKGYNLSEEGKHCILWFVRAF